MQGQPSVSVVIPCFNVARETLAEAVESAIAQDANICEVLIVDDASADVKAAQDVASRCDNVRVIRHEANRGGSAARNTGIDAAQGDLIALLDADDIWLPGKLSKQIEAMLKFGTGRISPGSFCASNCYLEPAGLRYPANTVSPSSYRPLWHYFLEQDCALQTSTLLLPARLAKILRFNPQLPRHQDWDFAIRLQQAGAQIVYLEECLSVYRLIDDPRRISSNPRATRNSLVWMRQMRGTIPAKTMQQFFFSKLISRKALAAPWSLLVAVSQAIMLSPSTALESIVASRRKPRRTFARAVPSDTAADT